jgi:hypothetical protein
MKQLVGRIRLMLPLAVLLLTQVYVAPAVYAAACSTGTNYGSVTVQIPQLARPGEYAIWIRMQASDTTHNTVQLELNKSDCLTLGGDIITSPKQWQWVPYSTDGHNAATYTFTNVANNSVRIIGVETGVKVDKLMVVPPGCIPTGSESQCQSGTDNATVDNTVTTVEPLSNEPVSGSIYPTATVAANAASIKGIVYGSDGLFIQEVKGAGKLDTTLLENGKHTITITITKLDGTTIDESTTIEVNNPESALSPIIRWFRLNERTIGIITTAVLSLALLVLLWTILKARYRRRRYLDFHGF